MRVVFFIIVFFVENSMAQRVNLKFVPEFNRAAAGIQHAPELVSPSRSFRYNYYESLGAACKAEYRMEKAVRVPLRIRMGSIESCNYPEGKPNAVHP